MRITCLCPWLMSFSFLFDVGDLFGDDADGDDVDNGHGEEACDKEEDYEDESDDVRVDAEILAKAATDACKTSVCSRSIELFIVCFDIRFGA